MGEEAVGALVEWVLGKTQHDDLLLDFKPYLGVRVPFLSCFYFSSSLVSAWTFGVLRGCLLPQS